MRDVADPREAASTPRWLHRLALLTMAIAAAQIAFAAFRWTLQTDSSSAFATLATDMSKGVYYRPLLADDGLGGSRYTPLFPWLQSLLLRAGIDALDAGVIVAAAAGLFCAAGLWQLTARAAGSRRLAVAAVALLCTSSVWRDATASGRCDTLAAVFNVYGIVALARSGGASTILAGALFGGAALAKFSDLWGVFGASLVFLGRRQVRELVLLNAAHATTIVAGTAAVDCLAGGNMVRTILTCATARSTDPGDMVRAPLHLLTASLEHDPLFVAPLLLALALALQRAPGEAFLSPLRCAWIAALSMSLAVFTTTSVEGNHLVDLHLLAAFTIAVRGLAPAAASALPARIVGWTLALTCLLLLGNRKDVFPWVAGLLPESRRPSVRSEMQAAAAAIAAHAPANAPVLADHNSLLLMAGIRPFVLDPWIVGALTNDTGKAQRARLDAMLAGKQFGLVALNVDMDKQAFILVTFFGEHFVELLRANYEPVPGVTAVNLFVPRR